MASQPELFIISDKTYAGEAAGQFIRKAITGADTIGGGHAYVKDGITKKFTIPRVSGTYTDIIQDYAPTPTPKGGLTVSGQTLTPAIYEIYDEFNPQIWKDHWQAVNLNRELLDRTLPHEVQSMLVQQYMEYHAKFFNRIIWNGDTTASGSTAFLKYFDGWLKKIVASADTILVSSPTTLTAANIFAEMLKGYKAIPEALRYNADMAYFVSYDTWDLFCQAQIDQVYKGVDITGEGEGTFKGRRVVRVADFPANKYVIARGSANPSSNLWVGMNSTGDDANIKLQMLQANSDLMFIKMLMAADVNVGWFEEIVYYG
jgi:hypothetical protein